MKKKTVLGVGNALVDVIALLQEDDIITKHNLSRGGMTLVDSDMSVQIYKEIKNLDKEIITGGSAANTIYTLANLGCPVGYLGKIGDDDLGDAFKNEIQKNNIDTHLIIGEKSTGRVMSLVSKDAERTQATYLGSAADLKAEEIMSHIFVDYEYLYIEGYLVQDHQLIEKIIDAAIEHGLMIVMDVSSYNIVLEDLEFFQYLIKEKVDILFANEEEAKAITGLEPYEAIDELANHCEIVVVKLGKDGSIIKSDNQTITVKSIKANAIDTTGAGDSYAAGFIYGLTQDYSLEKCGKIAALISGNVVQIMGAKLSSNLLEKIKVEINSL